MALDVVWIDAQIARLQTLRTIATDPEMLKLMRLAEANGVDCHVAALAAESIVVPRAADEARSVPTQKPRKGTLTKAVAKAALAETDWFDGYALTEKLRGQGFVFTASNPSISVIDVLRTLWRKKKLLDMREGQGNSPNQYRPKRAE